MQWQTLLNKEMVGNWRDRKWIWVPIVFILLAIMDPITNYYLPQILEAVGGLSEDAMIQLPTLTAVDAIMMSLSQLSTLGALVIALASMSIISGERKSGEAELILVKPVSFASYITSKWVALLIIVWSSYFVGILAAWYYIGVLYTFISVTDFLFLTFFYGLWLTFVVSISIFYNALSKSPGFVAFLTIATLIAMTLLTTLLGENFTWSPNHISDYIHAKLLTGEIPTALYGAASVTVLLSAGLIVLAIYFFKRKEHAA